MRLSGFGYIFIFIVILIIIFFLWRFLFVDIFYELPVVRSAIVCRRHVWVSAWFHTSMCVCEFLSSIAGWDGCNSSMREEVTARCELRPTESEPINIIIINLFFSDDNLMQRHRLNTSRKQCGYGSRCRRIFVRLRLHSSAFVVPVCSCAVLASRTDHTHTQTDWSNAWNFRVQHAFGQIVWLHFA